MIYYYDIQNHVYKMYSLFYYAFFLNTGNCLLFISVIMYHKINITYKILKVYYTFLNK